jgi:hypothetical protein
MTRTIAGVGPGWPPPDGAYDYLSLLSCRDWAWEGLRRNQTYQAEARARALCGQRQHKIGGWGASHADAGAGAAC